MNINIERVPLQRVDLPPFNEQVFVNSETRCKQDHSGVHVISQTFHPEIITNLLIKYHCCVMARTIVITKFMLQKPVCGNQMKPTTIIL